MYELIVNSIKLQVFQEVGDSRTCASHPESYIMLEVISLICEL